MNDSLRAFGYAVGIALAERKVPAEWDADRLTPRQVITGTVNLLDKLDDATDAYLAAHNNEHLTDRQMQRDLLALIPLLPAD